MNQEINLRKLVATILGAAWIGVAMLGAAPAHADEAGAAKSSSPIFARSTEFDFDPPTPGSYRLSQIRPAPDGWIVNSDGRRDRLKDRFAGRIVLLSMIYTRCADARGCPLATALLYDLFAASAQHADIGRNLKMISLSFDPRRDTPAAMREYGYAALKSENADKKAPWDFLTTRSEQDLTPILAGFGQTIEPSLLAKNRPSDDFDHLLRVYLVDRNGWVRNVYGLGFLDPRLVIADVRTLLAEEAGIAAGQP